MDIEKKLDEYRALLAMRKVVTDKVNDTKQEILDYFTVAGTHAVGDFVVTVEEKLSRTLDVEKIEELVQTNI